MANNYMAKQNSEYISYIIGLSLAISSSVFIGISFIVKKKALKRVVLEGNLRASSGGYSYLKERLWWLGLLTMGIGEGANLLAYAFVPAALVTPLGALSILVTAVLSSKFLGETLHFVGKVGCVLCVIGSIILIVHSPKSDNIKTFSELVVRLGDTLFLSYVFSIIILFMVVKYSLVPKYGKTNITVYLIICSAIGSLSVVFCKAISLGIRDGINSHESDMFIFWLIFIVAIAGIIIQINYLNKSLDIFNSNIVTPVYYVMFTTLVIVASGILFDEWIYMQIGDIIGCAIGFIILISAVFTLNLYKASHNIRYKNNIT
ncbi:magnesium transporter NIPA2 [Pieris napi]|uniref:magnesium transporter NIPA2 n=1 Tax=Pieris napi TaxID=78633 RepID=UPI001FBA3C3C|nr:magnesium transporter NIPA2 [Pieris napi]